MRAIGEIEQQNKENEEESKTIMSRIKPDKEVNKVYLPPFEVFEANKFPTQLNTSIPKKEVKVKADMGLVCVQTPNIEENTDAIMKDLLLNNLPIIPNEEQPTPHIKSSIQNNTENIWQVVMKHENHVNDIDQKLNILEAEINLIAKDIAIRITQSEDYNYLSQLDNKCLRLEKMMHSLLPSIAFGNLHINPRAKPYVEVVSTI